MSAEELQDAEGGSFERQQGLRGTFGQAGVGVGLIETATGRFIRVNRKYAEIVGYSQAEMTALDFMAITHPSDLAEDLASMTRLVQGGLREFSMEKRLLRKDGSPVWVALTVSPMWAVGDPPTQHIAIVQDISARRAAEEKSRQSRAELESTLAALPDLLFDVDDEGRIYAFHTPNPEQLAVPPEVFLGRKLGELLPAGPAAIIHDGIAEALARGRSSGRTYSLPMRGEERTFEISFARKPVDAGRPRLIAVARDVTERVLAEAHRRSLEAQLRQAQKMEAVGTLAAGIAHDFNNLLAVALLSVERARRTLPREHAAEESLDALEDVVWRARNLVGQILTFGRAQPSRRVVLSVNDAVLEATKLLRATIPAGIGLAVTLDPGATNVHADPTQLQQVLVNLGTNAWQAIERGSGTIRFGVRREWVGDAHPPLAPGWHACIEVSDDGVGMSPETVDRIFEPFFTTKAPGRGSGLGLSVVHGIVHEHGGVIDVRSAPGVGTTMVVRLASLSDSVEEAIVEDRPQADGQGASVMYVDDEPMLTKLMLRLLEHLGYRAVGFTRPRDALEALRASPASFDAIITDLSMPELSGLDLAREALAIRPGLPVILVSGFAPQLGEQLQSAGIVHRLTKPFEISALSQSLTEVIARGRGGG